MKFSIGIQATFTQPVLTRVMLENVKMSSERYCFSELENKIGIEKNIGNTQNVLGRENFFRRIN